ncbi:MAG: alkaline phosphatase family protein [Gemmatimonadales bacterium]
MPATRHGIRRRPGILGPVLFLAGSLALGCGAARAPERPRLVVLLVVDQFRADLLDHYGPAFQHGFRRLLDEGYRFTNAEHDHAITSSSQGHATLGTGRIPAHHGIVDNSWLQAENGRLRMAESTADSSVEVIGYPVLTGISPRDRLTDGLGDWILRADPAARAIAISQGSGSGMGLAPKDPRGEAYWSSPTARRFVTSTYYRDQYPGWVLQFDQEIAARIAGDTVWESSVPPAAVPLARRDDAPYEGDHVHTTFPHRFRAEVADPADPGSLFAWIRGRPRHDGLILALVREAIRAERLGRRGVTDYLGINLSSLDDVGHDYGPWSLEQLDALLRLDREIGEFLAFLDRTVGPDQYVLAVTGDHGVATAPEFAAEIGVPGRRVTQPEMDRLFVAVRALAPPPVRYDSALARRVAAIAESFDFVADAMTRDELEDTTATDPFIARFRNSYRPDRIPWFPLRASDGTTLAQYGVMARLIEGAIPDFALAVHGSPYDYDRRVPLLFFGAGITAGSSSERVRSVDVAPTLARLAGIAFPGDVDGRALLGP